MGRIKIIKSCPSCLSCSICRDFQETFAISIHLGYDLSVKNSVLENTFKLLEALNIPKNFLKFKLPEQTAKAGLRFLDAICISAGVKTGLYTSPHLISVTEESKSAAGKSAKKILPDTDEDREISENLVENGELDALSDIF